MKLLRFLILGLVSLGVYDTALAIPPPDFLISGIQSAMQVFGVAVAFLISLFFLLKDSFKLWWQLHPQRWVIVLSVLALLGVIVLFWAIKAVF